MRTCFVSTWFCFSWCVLFILVIHTHTHTHRISPVQIYATRINSLSSVTWVMPFRPRRYSRAEGDVASSINMIPNSRHSPLFRKVSTRLVMCWSGFVLVLVCFFFVIVWSLVLLYVVYFLLSRGLFLRSWFWSGLLLLICRYVALFLCWWVGLLLLLCWYFLFVNYWCLCYCVA